MLNYTKAALNKIKAAFLASKRITLLTVFSVIFFHLSLPSCAPAGIYSATESGLKADHAPLVLSTRHTHSALKKWSENNYQDSSEHQISFKSHHPHITESSLESFSNITSGYTINRITNRTDGIGLPALIKVKSKTDRVFTPITPDAYLSNLRPVNIIATQTTKKGILKTHFDVYHPHDQTHQGQSLKRQPNIVMQYIQDLPGNSGLDIKGLIRPSKYGKHQGFYLSEPYDKKRIPIIMIHGLASSPETFAEMADAINANAKLREKYQLWYYFYPTGTPWLVTASKFRNSYRELIKKLDPDGNDSNILKTTLIGHSMGGLIARLSLSKPGKTIQHAYFGNTPLNQIFKQQELKKIKEYFYFEPLTEPSRVIYLATPHRGSRIAKGLIGSITIKLISIPSYIIQQTADVITTGQLIGTSIPEQTKKLLTKGENSINQLQPNNPSLKALNQMQTRENLTSYSIIGDIGKPLLMLKTDGVVSHSSSKILQNKQQIIVPSNHDICGKPEAIDAVIQILSN